MFNDLWSEVQAIRYNSSNCHVSVINNWILLISPENTDAVNYPGAIKISFIKYIRDVIGMCHIELILVVNQVIGTSGGAKRGAGTRSQLILLSPLILLSFARAERIGGKILHHK